MDERRAQLVAAAEAMCVWVRTQRATWTEGSGLDFSTLRAPAFPSAAGTGAAPATFPEVSGAAPMFGSQFESVTRPWVDYSAHADTARRALAGAGARLGSLVHYPWKPALGAAALAAIVWTGQLYGPTWSGAIKRQLAAAGAHVSVFDRPTTAAPVPSPKGKPAERVAQPKRIGRLQVDSNPPGAQVVVDGRDRGTTPLTLTDLPVGSHVVVLTG